MYLYSKILLLTIFISGLTLAQNQENWCGSDAFINEEIAANPNYMQELAVQVNQIRAQAAQNPNQRSGPFIIPVVFHVIHDGGASNISMEQILSGIEVMNEDFNGLNTDASNIRNSSNAPFQPIYADVEVEFRLAKRDPNGNCTNGVQRKFAPHLVDDAGENVKSNANGGLSGWPNDKYINIWTVNSIASSGPGTTLGYAFLPYNNWGPGHGILNRHDRIGRVGTAAQNGGRTLTHEMGHICGLLHTFQSGCHSGSCTNSGDFVCDTPPAEQLFSCNSTNNTCTNVPAGDFFGFDAFDQNENHMAYSNCRVMFTEGQKTLMHSVFTSIPNFVSITSQNNLIATGVLEPDEICQAEFMSDNQIVCVGQTVNFMDNSFHGPTSWSWDFPGANPSNSTSQNPSVEYSAPGVYEVSLTVSDGNNNASTTKNAFITVLPTTNVFPILESFEEYTDLNSTSNWFTTSTNVASNFLINTQVGLTGNQSVYVPNFGKGPGHISELTSSNIDLSSIDNEVTLSFRYAYRKRNNNNAERLLFEITNNCGATFAVRRSFFGNLLGDQVATSSWTPSSENDWVTVHVTNITQQFWTSDFRYKFSFESDGGNNFYIDDINIYEGAPSDDLVLSNAIFNNTVSNFNVFPNPAEDFFNIQIEGENIQGSTKTILINNLGQTVMQNEIQLNNGKNEIIVPTQNLSKGVYQVKVIGEKGILGQHKIVLK